MKGKEIELGNYQPPPPPPPGQWDQFTRQAAIVILLFGVLFLINSLRPLINLLGITGIFILVLSYPINSLRTKTKLSYTAAVFVVFIPIALLLLLLIGSAAGWFVDNTRSVLTTLQQYLQQYQPELMTVDEAMGGTGSLPQWLDDVLVFVSGQISGLLAFVGLTATSFFLAFLFILEMPANLQKSFQSLSDVSQREFGILFDKLSNVWNGWLRSTVITSIIVGTTTALELFLFGIPYAGIIGVITGFLNLIPTFGPLISYLLIIFVTYTQGSSYITWSPLTLTLVVLIINMLGNQYIRLVIFPKLAGKAVHLPVFLVILGLVVAAVLWGVIGVILVIPLLGTAGEVLKYVLRKINREDPYPGEEPQTGYWTKEIVSK
jgi:predicted PurR-regulated permease PerM